MASVKTVKKAGGKKASGKKRAGFDVHPGVEMVQQWVETLKEKSGRSLEEWVKTIKKDGPGGFAETVAWLKKEHGVGGNSAWMMTERAGLGAKGEKGGEDDTPAGYLRVAPKWVDEQYAGKRAGLRPIFDALVAIVREEFPEAKVCPCQTIVPIYREHVVAQIKPTTISRVDFGLALAKHKGKLPKRLVDTGGLAKKDRITHRIEIACVEEIDNGVREWLRKAWELDG